MTTLETKTTILSDFWFMSAQDPEHEEFIEAHDIGIPLAVLTLLGHATATPTGVEWIHTDYADLLEHLGVDPHGEFDSLDELMEIADEQG